MGAHYVSVWPTLLLTVTFFISCCSVEAKFINLCPDESILDDDKLMISRAGKLMLLTGSPPVVVEGENTLHLDPDTFYKVKIQKRQLEPVDGPEKRLNIGNDALRLTDGDIAVSCKGDKKATRAELEEAFQRQSSITISTPTLMFSETTVVMQTSTIPSDRMGKSIDDRNTEDDSENVDPLHGEGHINHQDSDFQTTMVPTTSVFLQALTTPIPSPRQSTSTLSQISTETVTIRPDELTPMDFDQSSQVAQSSSGITSSPGSMVNTFPALPETSTGVNPYKEKRTSSVQTTIAETSTLSSSIVRYNSSSQTTKVTTQDEYRSTHSPSPVTKESLVTKLYSSLSTETQSPTKAEPSIGGISPSLRSASNKGDRLDPKSYSLYVILGIVMFLVTLLIIATACIVQRKRNSAKRKLTGTNEDFFITNSHNEACLLNADISSEKEKKENGTLMGMYSEIELEVMSPPNLQDSVLSSTTGKDLRESERPRCLSNINGMGI